MKNIGQEPDMQQLYDQSLFNRYYAYKNVNLTFGKGYGGKLIIGAFTLFVKLALSRFFRPNQSALKAIFVTWNPLHKKRAKDLLEDYRLIEFDSFSFSKEQLRHFAHISIRKFFSLLSEIRKSKVAKLENSSLYLTDSLSYRILFVIDYLALQGIVLRAERVFIAGHSDRPALIISKLCEANEIDLSMLQHGVLGKKERWMHLKANRFYYLYPFSKNYVQHLITVTPNTELHYLPKKASSLELKVFNKGKFDRNIAYATSPADSEKDIVIINDLKRDLAQHKYNLLIYPHPLEQEETYGHLKEDQRIFVSRERHKNIDYMISRYSTLGIEYHEQGIEPVFLNYENHRMDFLEEKSFLVFHSPAHFKKWLNKTLKSIKFESGKVENRFNNNSAS